MNQIHTQSRLGEVGSLHVKPRTARAAAALGALVVGASVSGCNLCIPAPVIPPEPLAAAACFCSTSGTNPDWHLNGTLLRGPGLSDCSGRAWLETTRFFLDGMTSDWNQTLTSVHVDKGALIGAIGATYVAANGFENVHLRGTIGCVDRSTAGVEARIDKVTPKSAGDAPPYYLYQLSLHNPAPTADRPEWVAACPEGAAAIPVAEVWDATGTPQTMAGAFTFACVNAAIGKCLDFGYVAWTGTDKRDLHLACTRMVRADYCGDGKSATKDGTPVNVWDTVNIQHRAVSTASTVPAITGTDTFEAAWDTHGAACFNHYRFASKNPDCTGSRTLPTGAASANGMLSCASDNPLPATLTGSAGSLVFDSSVQQ